MTYYIGTYINDTEFTIYKCNIEKAENSSADISNENTNIGANAKHHIEVHPCFKAGPKPSFIAYNKAQTFFYAVNELNMQEDGSYGNIVSIKKQHIKHTQSSYQLDTSITTKGDYPCHIALSKDEKILLVTNYGSGSLQVYGLADDGNIDSLIQKFHFAATGAHEERQTCSHLHQSLFSPCGNYVFVTDLGGDCIYSFSISSDMSEPLIQKDRIEMPQTGLGLRHMTFSDTCDYMYVSCELSSSVFVLSYDKATGILTPLKNYPVYSDVPCYPRTSASEISYYHNHLYMANRGDDTISVFKAHDDGTLTLLENVACGGNVPRHFKIFSDIPFGGNGTLIVANQESNNISIFKIDGDKLLGVEIVFNIKTPSCIL